MVFAHWDEPETNEDIRRVLSGLVRDRQLVPYMKREWRQRPRVFRRTPAAERWPSGGGNGGMRHGNTEPVLTYAEFQALQRKNGELPALGSSAAGAGTAATDSRAFNASDAPGNGGGGIDWLGAIAAVDGAALGSNSGAGDRADLLGVLSAPFSDAQPFKYTPDGLSDDVMELAARGVSEAQEAECFEQYERDLMACDMIAATYRDPRTLLLCKQRAFSNFQACRGF